VLSVNPVHLRNAARVLRAGGVIAYPTEAVWGLGADPWNESACRHLLAIKQRPWDKGLILVAADADQLAPFIEVPSNAVWKRAAVTWPGPNTWVFPCSEATPMWISGDHDSVAVRISAHETVRALCTRFGGALVSTSCNPSTRPPALSATQARLYFGDDLDYVLPGATGGLARPTSIRDAMTGHILRR
jgi:L-threonylcarbamoyladenylate synthase